MAMGLRLTGSTTEGLKTLIVESDDIRLTVLPQLGAKVLSLIWKPTGYEYLWRQPDRPLQLTQYGADFEAGDISGWDECFPTIGACVYPAEPWRGTVVPDHGELWSTTWDWTVEGDSLRMGTDGIRFPYRFDRALSFPGPGRLELTYAVENRAPFPLHALWSIHPFFRVSSDTEIMLPQPRTVRVEVSKSSRLGSFLAAHNWPVTQDRDGNAVDLSTMGPLDRDAMEKIFTDRLAEGWAALFTPSNEQFVAMTFDPAVVPFVGIAAMRGGWPETGQPSYSVILEPCTGWPDRLDIAIPRGDAMAIPGRSTVQWQVLLQFGTGRAALQSSVRSTTE
jgi:hypothetical protein